MSDLEADLYGDLYGNDDNEYGGPADEAVEVPSQPEPAVKTEVKPTPVPAASKPNLAAPHDTPVTQARPVPAAQPIASYAPVTQSIPTYEQPQNEYRGSTNGADYQNAGERSVRPSEMKDEGKMFIGGLNWDTTDEGLRTYFSQFGKVDACTIMRDAAGRSRCFAFLTFEDAASVNAVMAREHVLDGKIIDPKRAIPRQEHQRATKLFIGGLAGSVTSESMREFFSQFGKVIDSTVMLDRETGRSKGFGFISFEDTNVQPFLGFGNLEIDGKLIDVKLAQPRYQRDNYPNEDGDQSGGNFQGGGGNFGGQGNFAAGGGGGNPSFDPQALATLYTRMFQMANGQMNPAMMGMGGGMGMGMMGGMGMGMGRGMGMPGAGMGGMGGMGRGMAQNTNASLGPNVPRGPRAGSAAAPPGGPAAMGNPGVGPQRVGQRGQHNYHPYAR